jgi:hypothetical protein
MHIIRIVVVLPNIEVRPGSTIGLNSVGAAALATSHQSLMTSLPSSSNSLNNYFSKLLSATRTCEIFPRGYINLRNLLLVNLLLGFFL